MFSPHSLSDSRSSIWENGKYPVRLILNGQASKDIEWHCKHYVGRGLMKRCDSGDALAKEMKLDPSVLKATFDKYNEGAREKDDPFGKKVCLAPCLSLQTSLTCSSSSSTVATGEWTTSSTSRS